MFVRPVADSIKKLLRVTTRAASAAAKTLYWFSRLCTDV